MSFDPYTILGVPRTATADEIKIEYRQLCRVHHPDLGGDPEVMAKINRAYEILSDPAKRAKFDAGGDPDSSAEREAIGLAVALFEAGIVAMVRKQIADPIAFAVNTARGTISAARQDQLMQRETEKRLRAIAEKIAHKSGGENVLRSAVETKIEKLRAESASNDAVIANHEAAITFLKDYQYEQEKSPLTTYQQQLMHGYRPTGGLFSGLGL